MRRLSESKDGYTEVRHERHRDRQGGQGIHGRGTSRDEGARPRAEGGSAPRPAREESGELRRSLHFQVQGSAPQLRRDPLGSRLRPRIVSSCRMSQSRSDAARSACPPTVSTSITLPYSLCFARPTGAVRCHPRSSPGRSEEHTSELQSRPHLVCRLLLEKKKILNAAWTRSSSRQEMGAQKCASTKSKLWCMTWPSHWPRRVSLFKRKFLGTVMG